MAYFENQMGGYGGGQHQDGVGFGGGFGSPQTPQQKSGRRTEIMLPVTCHQLTSIHGNDDKLTIGTKEFTQVIVMGKILTIDHDPIKAEYRIEDGTTPTPISVRILNADTEGNSKTAPSDVSEQDNVRVYGRIRNFNGDLSITVFRMLPVTDPRELKLHQLEAKFAELFWSKDVLDRLEGEMRMGMDRGLAGTAFATKKAGASAMGFQGGMRPAFGGQAGAGIMVGGMSQMNGGMQQRGGQMMNQTHSTGLGRLHDQIKGVMAVHKGKSVQGTSIQLIMQQLPNFNAQQIQQACDILAQEGHIYSTIDETHFELCEF